MKNKILLFTVIFISLIASAMQSLAQTVQPFAMGDLSTFVVYTGSGIITDNKLPPVSSSYVGDIGTFSGAISVSPSVKAITYPGTGTTQQTQIDLDTLYNRISRMTSTVQATSNILASTITPGIYEYSSAGALTGALVLDAQNNSQSKFVFIFDNGLDITSLATMTLLNGAYADNVFWIIKSGNLNVGSSVTMLGNVITNTGSIIVNNSGNLKGRLTSLTGNITITTITASTPAVVPLPVKFESVTGQCDNNHMVIKFATASEQNNKYFIVQQSTDALNWIAKSKIIGAGNSSSLKDYSFIDSASAAMVNYYRIMQTDIDGNSTFSKVISVNACGNNNTLSVAAYPNPSNGSFKVTFSGDKSMVTKTTVMDLNGKKVFESTGLKSTIDLTNQPQGMYLLKVIANSQTFTTKIMVQK